MSWQDKYRERYEERLREKWANNGKRIWRPGDDMPSDISEVVIPSGTYVNAPHLKGIKLTLPNVKEQD